jgi:hypothetical protein
MPTEREIGKNKLRPLSPHTRPALLKGEPFVRVLLSAWKKHFEMKIYSVGESFTQSLALRERWRRMPTEREIGIKQTKTSQSATRPALLEGEPFVRTVLVLQ